MTGTPLVVLVDVVIEEEEVVGETLLLLLVEVWPVVVDVRLEVVELVGCVVVVSEGVDVVLVFWAPKFVAA